MDADDDYEVPDWQLLMDYAKRGHEDQLAEMLAESKADINKRDALGNTPLIWAAAAGHVDALRVLLENGADPLVANNVGDTALHKAAKRQSAECCELLIRYGAGPSRLARNKDGQAPVDFANQNSAILDHVAPPPVFTDGSDDAADDDGGDNSD